MVQMAKLEKDYQIIQNQLCTDFSLIQVYKLAINTPKGKNKEHTKKNVQTPWNFTYSEWIYHIQFINPILSF